MNPFHTQTEVFCSITFHFTKIFFRKEEDHSRGSTIVSIAEKDQGKFFHQSRSFNAFFMVIKESRQRLKKIRRNGSGEKRERRKKEKRTNDDTK